MKILVISNLCPPAVPSGYEIPCRQLCDALTARGHDVSLLVPPPAVGNDSRHLRGLKLRTPFLFEPDCSGQQQRAVARQNEAVTSRAIAEINPDTVVMCSHGTLTDGPSRAAAASGVPVVRIDDGRLKGSALSLKGCVDEIERLLMAATVRYAA